MCITISVVGSITNQETKIRVTLSQRTLIGRSPDAVLTLSGQFISGEHASIFYDEHWVLRDLGSTNGTWIDGRLLEPGEKVVLKRGSAIRFGAAESVSWILQCDRAPGVRAWELASGEAVDGSAGILALPSAGAPLATVYFDEERGWVGEGCGAEPPLRDQQILEVAGQSYRLELPERLHSVARTAKANKGPRLLNSSRLEFTVSRDEETVKLELVTPSERVVLPSQVHNYLLVTLARARQKDVELPEAEQGWVYVEDLERQLDMDRTHINVQLYRARTMLGKADVVGAAGIVERRTNAGQLRFGVSEFQIHRN